MKVVVVVVDKLAEVVDWMKCLFCDKAFVYDEHKHLTTTNLMLYDCPHCGFVHTFKRKGVNTMYG